MKYSKYYKKKYLNNKKFEGIWLTKILLSIIIVLVCLIATNFNSDLRDIFKREVLEENMNFGDLNSFYNKMMLGKEETKEVAQVIIDDSNMIEEDGRYKFNYGVDYPVEVLAPGIIVYSGEKDDLGETVIVQGNDGVDIWYSGVNLNSYSLYDYVSKDDILGNSNELYVTVSILKDGKLLKYEEYFK